MTMLEADGLQLAIYAIGAAIVLALLFSIPRVGAVLRSALSIGVLAFGLFILFQQAPYNPALARIAASLGLDDQSVAGDEVRIQMSPDGHFWAQVEINGTPRRMLIDSGATLSALSARTAEAAGVETDASLLPVTIRTANGVVQAQAGEVERLRLGAIEAQGLKVIVSPALGPIDVLGMNFLSQLAAWRVEGRTLILVPEAAAQA
jgi:aspartyl protease family protein